MRKSWSLLPSTAVLFNNARTIKIEQVCSVWSDVVVYICERAGADKTKVAFLSSAGPLSGVGVNTSHAAHHDQTMKSLGDFQVANIVHFKNGKFVSSENDKYLTARAPLSVFK